MSDNISQSAPLASISSYLKRVNGLDEQQAQLEAQQIIHDFQRMQRQGYIEGWYFDEQGHLALIPSDDVLARMQEK
ncbi:hypothetical protein [Ferrimonas lipolytica]|uniref:Uncharacterized protein n=1 Tax=Ferrimonas lipolytica TaxID=2724191 RepID=A0A6H1UB78_9GAMM|nr:hypothetical protein [Ferrimonas lipolytica]QIZ75840.1 hypothetical protein HER31_02345 [Ferrimonas lipolytica]